MEEEPPYFGWVKPSARGEGRLDFQIEDQRLTLSQYSEANRVAEFVGWVRPFLIDFLVLDDYFGDVIRLPDKLADLLKRNPRLVEKTGTFLIKSHVLTEKSVNGFFAAAGTFRDRLLSRTGSAKTSELGEFVRHLYDTDAAYRLGYNLRNLGLHKEALIHVIPMRRHGIEDVQTDVSISLSRDRILSILDINKIVQTDLKAAPSEIELLPLCREYMESLAQLFAKLLSTRAEELHFTLGFAKMLRSGARGLPDDATPMLFFQLPSESRTFEGEFTSKTQHFSLDELEILGDLFPALRI